ncbi:DUF5776 domain-containing protein [Lentilactobacillus raoultii]|uniref:DUF5776 domain-containing protein n=1 Tax=Lentilactobacillus raoultii TaxID=1987503 RepID=A0ABW3PEP8_9LACO|nr:DUF5776 domain-containing protein [Lentilactobacillus raoultii]
MNKQLKWLIMSAVFAVLLFIGFNGGITAKAYTTSGPFYNSSSATDKETQYGDVSFTSYFETKDGKSSFANDNTPTPRTLIDPTKQPVGSTIDLVVTMTNNGTNAEKITRSVTFAKPATPYNSMQIVLAKNNSGTFQDVIKDATTDASGFTVTYNSKTYDDVKTDPDSVDELDFSGSIAPKATVTYKIPVQIKEYLAPATSATENITLVDPNVLDDSIGGYRFNDYFGLLSDWLYLLDGQTPDAPKAIQLNFAGKAKSSVPVYPTSVKNYAVTEDSSGNYSFDPTDFGLPADQKDKTSVVEILGGPEDSNLKLNSPLHAYGSEVTNFLGNQIATGPLYGFGNLKVAQYLAMLHQPSANGEISNRVVFFEVLKNDAPKITGQDATVDQNTAITAKTFKASPDDATVNVLDSNDNSVSLSDKGTLPAGNYTVWLTKEGDVSKKVNLTVKSVPTPPTPNPNTGNTTSGTTVTPITNTSSSSTTVSSSSSSSSSTSKPSTSTQTSASKVAVKGEVVYATKKIGLYKGTHFTKANRLTWYPKQKRVNRPMFVVTGYKRAANGAMRYKVRDVNHGRKTLGKKGYITASQKYVVPVYYASVPKAKKIIVISTKGVNAYKSANLSGKVKHYKKGAHLTVKKLVKHNLTTRYQLSNGKYVTANKKLVIAGNH